MITDLTNAKNNWIYQSNRLIEASYTLTVLEQKVLRILAAMIKKDDIDFKEYEFKAIDLCKLMGYKDNKNVYRELDRLTDILMTRVIKIKGPNNNFVKYHFVEIIKYQDGILKLKINPEMKPFYINLDWYTKYQLKNIMQFKSTYSFKLYELMKQYQNIGNRVMTIIDLRILLDIDKKQYPKFANLKQKVIGKAIKEINDNTDLYIDYEELKEARKVTSIRFYIRKNKAENEVAATSSEDTLPVQDENINQVKKIIKEDITDIEAGKILDAAAGDLEKIKEKYAIVSKLKKVNNVIGAMITALKENWTSKGKTKISVYQDYKQKEYNIKEIEKQLLGWD